MSIIIIVSVAAALINDIRTKRTSLVAVDNGFEDEIRGELDEGKYMILTTSFINQKETGRDKLK